MARLRISDLQRMQDNLIDELVKIEHTINKTKLEYKEDKTNIVDVRHNESLNELKKMLEQSIDFIDNTFL